MNETPRVYKVLIVIWGSGVGVSSTVVEFNSRDEATAAYTTIQKNEGMSPNLIMRAVLLVDYK